MHASLSLSFFNFFFLFKNKIFDLLLFIKAYNDAFCCFFYFMVFNNLPLVLKRKKKEEKKKIFFLTNQIKLKNFIGS